MIAPVHALIDPFEEFAEMACNFGKKLAACLFIVLMLCIILFAG